MNGKWLTKGTVRMPADEIRIKGFLQFLKTLTKMKLFHRTKKTKRVRQDSNRIEIKIGMMTYRLYIGNSDLTKNYLMLNDEPIIFEAEGFDDVFDPFDYRDLSLHPINTVEQVSAIKITWETNESKLEKNKDVWLVNGKKAVRERADYLLNNIQTLKATDIITPQQFNPQTPHLTHEEGNKNTLLTVYNFDDSSSIVKMSNSKFIYKVPNVYLESVKKAEDDLM